MGVDENKTELKLLIADTVVSICEDIGTTVVMTRKENVVSNHPIEREYIQPCHKEEADDRMFVHAKDLSRLGFEKLSIVSVDSDVIVIALYAYWFLDLTELWVEFGCGKDRRWRPIHHYAKTLGESCV